MALTDQEMRAVLEFKRRAQALLGANLLEMRLFGSRARGEGDEDSDVDLCVLVREAPVSVRGSLYEIAADILLAYEVEISPLVLSLDHFEDTNGASGFFRARSKGTVCAYDGGRRGADGRGGGIYRRDRAVPERDRPSGLV